MQHKFSILIAFCLLLPTLVRAQETDRAKTEFFEAKIRPALVAHCYECHSTKSGKARGSLKVDSRDALLAGGDTGPAVVARSLEKSLLFKAITHDGDFQMPPKGKLPDDVIADFRKWILMGAPDPRVTEINPAVKTVIDVEKGREYWAYRDLVQPEAPSSADSSWARTPIDQFISAKLAKNKLKPVADAPPRLLVRRLYFVLTGLPPAPDEIEDWSKRIGTQPSEQATQQVLSELVDPLPCGRQSIALSP